MLYFLTNGDTLGNSLYIFSGVLFYLSFCETKGILDIGTSLELNDVAVR
jgi:hypothetical protein